MTIVNGEQRVAAQEPTYDDYELAIRSLSGAKLRPGEADRVDSDPAILEARYRVENCMRSEIQAARASLLALGPKVATALSDLLDSKKESIRLGAVTLWMSRALPPETVQVAHTHQLDSASAQLTGDAAAAFARLTDALSERLTGHRTIDISASPHLLRGEAARPLNVRFKKREEQPVE